MLLDGFFDRTPRFRQHAGNPVMPELIAFFSDPVNLDRMLLLNDFAEMAPLSAIVAELENNFESRINFASLDVRQMIGSMIKDALAMSRLTAPWSAIPATLKSAPVIAKSARRPWLCKKTTS